MVYCRKWGIGQESIKDLAKPQMRWQRGKSWQMAIIRKWQTLVEQGKFRQKWRVCQKFIKGMAKFSNKMAKRVILTNDNFTKITNLARIIYKNLYLFPTVKSALLLLFYIFTYCWLDPLLGSGHSFLWAGPCFKNWRIYKFGKNLKRDDKRGMSIIVGFTKMTNFAKLAILGKNPSKVWQKLK